MYRNIFQRILFTHSLNTTSSIALKCMLFNSGIHDVFGASGLVQVIQVQKRFDARQNTTQVYLVHL